MAQENALLEDDEDDSKNTEYVAVDTPDEPIAENDDDEDETDLKAKDDEEGDDIETIRARRRDEKRERKERRDKAINRDKLELNFLRNRNDELERRVGAVETHAHQTNISQIDYQLQQAINEVDTAEKIIARAIEAGNGEDVTKAMGYRDLAMARAKQLDQHKQQQTYQPPQNKNTAPDNEVMHYAKEFLAENKWYDPAGKDEDSAIVLAIDARLAQEGFDPRTEDYWDELHSRVKRRLPEKFKEPIARKPTGGPAVGSGREHAPSSTRKEIYISPERKAAMQEAGVWDDPVLRQRYVKRYAEYDKEHRN
jgi:hypothetical protein